MASITYEKFTIFGSGFNKTRNDSGTGEGARVFSHPFVPLGSKLYAGQFLFYVPDKDDNIIDAVKDDIAHCTFTPSIGSTFDTEGETTVSVSYYREYENDNGIIVVEKNFSEKITVVDHGNVTTYGGYNPSRKCYIWSDIYSDGYCFIHPESTTFVGASYVTVQQSHDIKKLSSFQWRVNRLGGGTNGCFRCKYLEDISELAYADTSNVTRIDELFSDVYLLTDWSPIADWDVSNVTEMHKLVVYCTLSNLTCFAKWNVGKVVNMSNLFESYFGASLQGLENWNVSNVRNISGMFAMSYITSVAELLNWNINGVTSLNSFFNNCYYLASLHGLENWDVSEVTDLHRFCHQCYAITSLLPLANWNPKPTTCELAFNGCTALASYKGIENFDLSNCTNCDSMFNNNLKITSLEGLENWDVSKVQNFNSMFGQGHWIESLEPIKNWIFTSMVSAGSMFGQNGALREVNVPWSIPSGANISGMFTGQNFYYSTKVGIYIYETASYYYDYNGGRYAKGKGALWDDEQPLQQITKDASDAESWTSGSARGAFNDVWTNRPSWN